MFIPLRAIDTNLIIPLLICWLVASLTIIRLGKYSSPVHLFAGARHSLLWLGFSILLLGAKITTLALQWLFFGWIFVEDRVLLEGLLLLLPTVAVLIFSLPRLRKLVGFAPERDNEAKITLKEQQAVSSPGLLVPVLLALLGALIGTYLTELYNDPLFSLILVILFVLSCPLLWFWFVARRNRATIAVDSRRRRLLRSFAALTTVVIAPPAWYVGAMQLSRLPGRVSMMNHDVSMDHSKMISVTQLTGPKTGKPDQHFILTAQEVQVPLSSGQTVAAWSFNGQLPGPELRVRQGELIEVTLINCLPSENVTIHWHGLDVPNAEDGVAGVTQDAVEPGKRYTYRFQVTNNPGTYWYHSHQVSSEAVAKGLFGMLVVLPREEASVEKEEILIAAHTWKVVGEDSRLAFGSADTLKKQSIKAGTLVRLRLLNTDNTPTSFVLTGTSFKVVTIDGMDINAPTDLSNMDILVASGGRYDLTFTMPQTPVHLGIHKKHGEAGLLLSANGAGEVPEMADGPTFNPATYGSPGKVPFGLNSHYEREFTLLLDGTLGFYDGKFGNVWPINGKIFPNTPMLMVREGDLVKTTFVNRSYMDHPMHLHGHHMLVLSRNGQPITGSPWWVDTLNVAPGESYETAFRADNPGIWMDHCHNLSHATAGMVLHLGYEGVMSPFAVGRDTGNQPE